MTVCCRCVAPAPHSVDTIVRSVRIPKCEQRARDFATRAALDWDTVTTLTLRMASDEVNVLTQRLRRPLHPSMLLPQSSWSMAENCGTHFAVDIEPIALDTDSPWWICLQTFSPFSMEYPTVPFCTVAAAAILRSQVPANKQQTKQIFYKYNVRIHS